MNLVELQNRIYNQNKELGWHDDPRSFNTFVCLFHSELSEAMEGLRKGLMDDHLPHHHMFQVEVADFVIRVLDWFGCQHDLYAEDVTVHNFVFFEDIDFIAELHGLVSSAKYFYDQCEPDDCYIDEECVKRLNEAVMTAFSMADKGGWDLLQIINKKVEYNKTRADHKRENRDKEGGKKF